MEVPVEVPEDRAILKEGGEELAEAWFETEAGRPVLVIRIGRERFPDDDATRRGTIDALLRAAAIPSDEVESWRLEGPIDSSHRIVRVLLKPPASENPPFDPTEDSRKTWQALEVAWKTIIGLEAIIDTTRLNMDGLRSEMENAFKKSLGVEEKVNALQSDVAAWNKAKTRVHHSLPKVREFIHRATWALAIPERKLLEEIFKQYSETRNPPASADNVRERLEHLQKDRQVLVAVGNAVHQECRGVLSEIQRALSSLQRNAADNARRKRSASREKGKHL